MSISVRRVVTAHNKDGKAIFASDEPPPSITLELGNGMTFFSMWDSDSAPVVPSDGQQPSVTSYFPPLNGSRFGVIMFPPESEARAANFDLQGVMAEIQAKLPGMIEGMALEDEAGQQGMHATRTVDYEVILSGEVWLELDDGAEVLLTPGTCLVQNGTRHSWHNRGTEPCLMAYVLLGAEKR